MDCPCATNWPATPTCRVLVIGMTDWSAVAAVFAAAVACSHEFRYFVCRPRWGVQKGKLNEELYALDVLSTLTLLNKGVRKSEKGPLAEKLENLIRIF